ncbi:MAG TPA: GNAT family N-acetyltransferase [Phycisphaerae bacterium]|jgi:acyl-CoA hydrolase/GNAT superfamily N-acetyltransferase|nr:GNAT family N-acetyltransferase [Phycisphaerae bacterium]HRS26919.1 GNAT family N-acetyltransferase [Phycisphaerae bacterium]HRT41788.1 GNAT family N-acetyltransferase [Phycisphaerae bacterium]
MPKDWTQRYAHKIVTAEEAIGKIRPGDRVYIGSACGEPQELVRVMGKMGDQLTDTEIVHVLTLGVAPYTDPRFATNFRANAFFIGNSVREAVNEARADYTPVFLSQVPGLFRSHRLGIDVALVTVSPPDEHGHFSLGVAVDIGKAAVESAKIVVAQVNRRMPRTLGDSFVHIDQLDFLVPHDEPLLEWPVGGGEPDEVTRQLAANLARLITDGSTLQLGIGRVPDAVLGLLTNKHDLGIHTEMFSDGVLKLVEAGVITGKHKTLHRGKIVGSFAAGSQALFDFLDNNPQIEMHPSEYTNSPFVIAQHDNMVAINSALEVDLTGQVVADSLGQMLYSGLGGHADFMRGAALAKNGKPVIAVPSTAMTPEGLKSRIVATLQPGAGVITTRGDVHYVVTEYGSAYLHGKTMRERAMSLISIAHPDFRSELLLAAKRRRIVYPNQIMPPPRAPYPAEYETTFKLRNGQEAFVRPIRPDDEPLMRDMFYEFSEQTIYLRYHASVKAMPHNKLQVFCNVDYDTEMALIALTGTPGNERVIGVGRYMTDAAKQSAEVAFTVSDDFQRHGLGTYLFERLVEIAKSKGIRFFHAYVLVENSGMLKIFHRSGLNIETSKEGDVVKVSMTLPETKERKV